MRGSNIGQYAGHNQNQIKSSHRPICWGIPLTIARDRRWWNHCHSHRRTKRGGGGSPLGLKNSRAKSVFRASASCSKILNDKKYCNTVKNVMATLFFRASAICTKILNDEKYVFTTVNSGQTLFFKASASCSKILNDKKYIFNTVNSGHTLFFRARASCSKILNVKCTFNTVKNFRENTVFQGRRNLLKNPERWKNFQYNYSVYIHLGVIRVIWASVVYNLDQSRDWIKWLWSGPSPRFL